MTPYLIPFYPDDSPRPVFFYSAKRTEGHQRFSSSDLRVPLDFVCPFCHAKRNQESAVSCGAMTNSQHLKLGFIAYRRFPRYFLRLHLKFYRFRSTGGLSLKGLCFHGRKNSDLGLRKDSTQVVKTAPDIDAIIVKAFQNDGQRQVLRGECTEYERINQMVV